MLVKFIPTLKAGTSVDAVLAYVFQDNNASGKPRQTVKQVAGTMPQLLSLLALEVNSKTPYTHSVLTFSDEDMARTTEAERLEVLNSYVDELAAGLGDKRRMPYLAVSHGDHYHVVTLRYDLRSGKVYQPFVTARGDVQRFNVWKDLQNGVYGLDAPSKSGSLFRLSAKHAGDDVKGLLNALNRGGAEVVSGMAELDAGDVVQELLPVIEAEGFEVARVTKSGFSVTSPSMKRNVRFRYTRKMMGLDDGKDVVADVVGLRERLACYREKLMLSMGRYHGEAEVPDVMDSLGMEGDRGKLYSCHFISSKNENGIFTF